MSFTEFADHEKICLCNENKGLSSIYRTVNY